MWYLQNARLNALKADVMSAWQPATDFKESRSESGVPVVPVAAQSQEATITRRLSFPTSTEAQLARDEAVRVALDSGWTAVSTEHFYVKSMPEEISAGMSIIPIDARLTLTISG